MCWDQSSTSFTDSLGTHKRTPEFVDCVHVPIVQDCHKLMEVHWRFMAAHLCLNLTFVFHV